MKVEAGCLKWKRALMRNNKSSLSGLIKKQFDGPGAAGIHAGTEG